MSDGNPGWNGIFHGHRVPFSINAVLLGFLFVATTHLALGTYTGLWNEKLGMQLINPYDGQISHVSVGKIEVSSWVVTPLRDIAISLGIWSEDGQNFANPLRSHWYIWAWVILLGIWSLFAPAICRLAALRVARDENLSTSEALSFAAGKARAAFITPLLFALLTAILFFLVNGFFGLIMGIPYVGEVFGATLLAPVFLMMSLLIIWAIIGQVAGINLMAAGIAAEGSDGLDGMSRAINYIFSRPWHVILHNLLIVISLLILLCLGDLFYGVTKHSISSLYSSKNVEAPFHMTETAGDRTERGFYAKEVVDTVVREGKSEPDEDVYRGRVVVRSTDAIVHVVWQRVDGEVTRFPARGAGSHQVVLTLEEPPEEGGRTNKDWRQKVDAALVIDPQTVDSSAEPLWSRIWWSLFFYLLIIVKYVSLGYAAAYFLAATTTSYFLLRKEVDGTETDEVAFDEDDFDLPPPAAPSAPPAPKPPASPAPPSPAPASPATASPAPSGDAPPAPVTPAAPKSPPAKTETRREESVKAEPAETTKQEAPAEPTPPAPTPPATATDAPPKPPAGAAPGAPVVPPAPPSGD